MRYAGAIEKVADTNETIAKLPDRLNLGMFIRVGAVPMFAAVLVGIGLHAGIAQMLLSMIAVTLAGGIALIAVVASVVQAARGQFAQHKRMPLIALVVAAMLCVATFVAILVGVAAEGAYLRRARAWCELQIPAIEAYKAEHGVYPKNAADVVDVNGMPWVVSTFDPWIHGDENAYTIDLSTNFTSGWSYWSKSGLWSRYD